MQSIQLAVHLEMVPVISSQVLPNVILWLQKPSVFAAFFMPNLFSGPQ